MKGCRFIYQTLKQSYGVHVPRDSVMQILKEIDSKAKVFFTRTQCNVALWMVLTNSGLTVFLSMAALMVFQEGYSDNKKQ